MEVYFRIDKASNDMEICLHHPLTSKISDKFLEKSYFQRKAAVWFCRLPRRFCRLTKKFAWREIIQRVCNLKTWEFYILKVYMLFTIFLESPEMYLSNLFYNDHLNFH